MCSAKQEVETLKGHCESLGGSFEGISIHENWVILHTRGWKVEGGGWRCEVKMEGGR